MKVQRSISPLAPRRALLGMRHLRRRAWRCWDASPTRWRAAWRATRVGARRARSLLLPLRPPTSPAPRAAHPRRLLARRVLIVAARSVFGSPWPGSSARASGCERAIEQAAQGARGAARRDAAVDRQQHPRHAEPRGRVRHHRAALRSADRPRRRPSWCKHMRLGTPMDEALTRPVGALPEPARRRHRHRAHRRPADRRRLARCSRRSRGVVRETMRVEGVMEAKTSEGKRRSGGSWARCRSSSAGDADQPRVDASPCSTTSSATSSSSSPRVLELSAWRWCCISRIDV